MANKPFIFRPIRGTEETIRSIDKHEGYLYFAYDTGNIYLDKDGIRHQMGGTGTGNSGFVWANGTDSTIIKLSEDEDDTQYKISLSALKVTFVPCSCVSPITSTSVTALPRLYN